MSSQIPSSRRERRVSFHAEAPYAKHQYRYNNRHDVRMAGQIWGEGASDVVRYLQRKRDRDIMRRRPLWFDERSTKGPDEDYNTVEFIKQIPDQARYTY
jgi:hypothetical protein